MIRLFLFLLVWTLRAALRSRGSLALENLAHRQQLATYAPRQKPPRLKPEARVFWVALSMVSPLQFGSLEVVCVMRSALLTGACWTPA